MKQMEEPRIPGDRTVRSETGTENLISDCASDLYGGGWRAEDREDIKIEYGYTEEEEDDLDLLVEWLRYYEECEEYERAKAEEEEAETEAETETEAEISEKLEDARLHAAEKAGWEMRSAEVTDGYEFGKDGFSFIIREGRFLEDLNDFVTSFDGDEKIRADLFMLLTMMRFELDAVRRSFTDNP